MDDNFMNIGTTRNWLKSILKQRKTYNTLFFLLHQYRLSVENKYNLQGQKQLKQLEIF